MQPTVPGAGARRGRFTRACFEQVGVCERKPRQLRAGQRVRLVRRPNPGKAPAKRVCPPPASGTPTYFCDSARLPQEPPRISAIPSACLRNPQGVLRDIHRACRGESVSRDIHKACRGTSTVVARTTITAVGVPTLPEVRGCLARCRCLARCGADVVGVLRDARCARDARARCRGSTCEKRSSRECIARE